MNKKIWLSSPHMGGDEIEYVKKAFDENWIAPLGPNVNEFEHRIEEYLGVRSAAALSSGTAAIHLALILSGVQYNDDVIVSTFTFSASVNPIAYLGANPVFVDSEDTTWNMDPKLLEEAIQDRIKNGRKPKAIIVVHLYGMSAQIDEICMISKKYGISLIEDAAEALGSSYNGQKLGTFGDYGILSFNGNKIITTSGGGALVSNNSAQIDKARFLATQARDNAPHYQHSNVGYNYRMSNIVAGIGIGQMNVLNERINRRREINSWYSNVLKDFKGISVLREPSNRYFSNFWLTTVVLEGKNTIVDREELRLKFEAENIEARPLWKPMHQQPIFQSEKVYRNGVSEKLFDIGLCLPSGSNMIEEDFKRIKLVLHDVFRS